MRSRYAAYAVGGARRRLRLPHLAPAHPPPRHARPRRCAGPDWRRCDASDDEVEFVASYERRRRARRLHERSRVRAARRPLGLRRGDRAPSTAVVARRRRRLGRPAPGRPPRAASPAARRPVVHPAQDVAGGVVPHARESSTQPPRPSAPAARPARRRRPPAPRGVEQHVAGQVGVHELVGAERAVGSSSTDGRPGSRGPARRGIGRRPEDQPLGQRPPVVAVSRPAGASARRGQLGVQQPPGRQRDVEVVARGGARLVAAGAPAVDDPRPVARRHRHRDPQVAAAPGGSSSRRTASRASTGLSQAWTSGSRPGVSTRSPARTLRPARPAPARRRPGTAKRSSTSVAAGSRPRRYRG